MTLETLRKLVALDPADPLSRFALGKKLYETSQNLPEAADHLRFANAADPSHLATYLTLAKCLTALGHRDEARAVLRTGLPRCEAVTEGMGRDIAPALRDLLTRLETPPPSTPSPDIAFRLAQPHEVVDLRHRVLRLGMPRDAAIFPGDDAPDTLHGVAEVAGHIACCATFMPEPPPPFLPLPPSTPSDRDAGRGGAGGWRLRGMATDESYRSLRLGSRLLRFLEPLTQQRRPTGLLWCNARIGAVRFYEREGWQVVSPDPYEIPTAGLHHTMVKRLPPPTPQ